MAVNTDTEIARLAEPRRLKDLAVRAVELILDERYRRERQHRNDLEGKACDIL